MPLGPGKQPYWSITTHGLLCFLLMEGKQVRSLEPGLPSLHQLIYMDLQGLLSCLHAHGFLLSSPGRFLYKNKRVCSVPPLFSQQPIQVLRASCLERGCPLKSRESRDQVGGHPAIQAGVGLEPTLSALPAPKTHSFLPSPHCGAGGLPEG